jgi:hypothetical protein
VAGCCECGNETSGPTKYGEIDWPRNSQLMAAIIFTRHSTDCFTGRLHSLRPNQALASFSSPTIPSLTQNTTDDQLLLQPRVYPTTWQAKQPPLQNAANSTIIPKFLSISETYVNTRPVCRLEPVNRNPTEDYAIQFDLHGKEVTWSTYIVTERSATAFPLASATPHSVCQLPMRASRSPVTITPTLLVAHPTDCQYFIRQPLCVSLSKQLMDFDTTGVKSRPKYLSFLLS